MKKEIVFSPSAQGCLRMAQFTGVGSFPKSLVCDIKDKNGKVPDDIQKLNKENEEKWNNSRPISVIRLPGFVTKEDFEWAIEEATKRKRQTSQRLNF